MHKCNNCGTEYEGNVCPNCGSVGQGRKRCPNCGAIIAQSSKFCNGCGYSFESGAVPKEAKAQSAALVWINKHKIGLIISSIILVTAIVLLSLIPTFIKASVNGTYYKYNAGADTFDPENYITLKTGKWTDSEGFGGNYKVSGKTVTLKMDMFGEEMDFTTATVENGMLSYDVMGEKTVYLARKHRHKYGEWQDKDELTCTQDETQVRLCGCGKEDVEVITEARGHQGNWKTTKEVTCTDYGEREVHCTVCDKDIVEYIEPLGHKLEFTVNKTTHIQKCIRCKQVLTENEAHDNAESCSVCGYPFIYELNKDGTEYAIIGVYSSAIDSSVTVPAKYNGIPVTSISANAYFRELENISVDAENLNYKSVSNCILTKDGKELVAGCKTSVIPDGVTSIGFGAFYGCRGLTSITIPDSVTSIGINAFGGCSGLIQTENGVQYVDKWVIDCDTSVTSVTLRNNTKGIAVQAFYGCRGLTSITIPDSVISIDARAFEDCSGLMSITIPDSVISIGSSAFSGCSGLTSVIIGNGVNSIGERAFEQCGGLTRIIIPKSVTNMGGYVFQSCENITIYCEAKSKPRNWDRVWNPLARPVEWGI